MAMRKIENKIYQIYNEGKDNGYYFETKQGLLDGPYGFPEEARWQKDFKEKGIKREREEKQWQKVQKQRAPHIIKQKRRRKDEPVETVLREP
jgi:hypothetical protein